jgi:hypothetical protein
MPRMMQVTVDHRHFAALIGDGADLGGAAGGGAAGGGAAGGGAAGGGAAGGDADVRTPSTGGLSRLPPSMLPLLLPPTAPSPDSGTASAALSRSLPGSGAATARSKVPGEQISPALPKRSSFSTKAPADAPVRSPRPPLALSSCSACTSVYYIHTVQVHRTLHRAFHRALRSISSWCIGHRRARSNHAPSRLCPTHPQKRKKKTVNWTRPAEWRAHSPRAVEEFKGRVKAYEHHEVQLHMIELY